MIRVYATPTAYIDITEGEDMLLIYDNPDTPYYYISDVEGNCVALVNYNNTILVEKK